MHLMKPDLSTINRTLVLPLCCLVSLIATGCGGGKSEEAGAPANAAVSEPSGGNAVKDQNACHLLTHEEVSALVEEKIVMSDQTDAGESWSTCEWEDENGLSLFMLTAYWADGKEQWDAWRAAQGLGNEMFEQSEGVSVDDVVEQGPVAGIGDGAYFSELLPSLVLKGDVLFEMNLFFVPHADSKSASLAQKLLATIE
jgi:hypothetical protein